MIFWGWLKNDQFAAGAVFPPLGSLFMNLFTDLSTEVVGSLRQPSNDAPWRHFRRPVAAVKSSL